MTIKIDLPNAKLQPETELVGEAQQGDIEAFNQLVVRYQTQVYQLALWIMKDEFQADDVTQNTFIAAYLKIRQFRGGSFRAWIMRIASNACYDELRRQKRHPNLPLTAEDADDEQDLFRWLSDLEPSVEQHVERNEVRRYVQQCIDELPVLYRMPIVLIDLQEMNYQETSSALGIPLGTLKSRLSRARMMLQERFKESTAYQGETGRFLAPARKQTSTINWVAMG